MDSVRLQILNAIQDLFSTVEGVGDTGGPKKMPLDIMRYPALFVQPGQDVPLKYVGDSIDRELQIDAIMFELTEGNVMKAIETFLPKVQKKVAENYTLGGLCIDFSEPEGGEGISSPTAVEGRTDVAVVINYRVLYRIKANDPYSQ